MAKEKNKGFTIVPPEVQIAEVLANRYRDIFDADGGKLYITTERLVFIPTIFNIDRSQEEIPLSEILEIGTFSAMGIIPNGVVIKTSSGEAKFIINKRDKIIELIKQQLGKS